RRHTRCLSDWSSDVCSSDLTQAKLKDFVDYINQTPEPIVRQAAFITFNGDLHNGGSPGGFREPYVATTYAEESKAIVLNLKNLRSEERRVGKECRTRWSTQQ